MENFKEKWSLNDEKKQRVILSKAAFLVLMQDMDRFDAGNNKSGFVNRIMLEYAKQSDAVRLLIASTPAEKGKAFNVRLSNEAENLIFNQLREEQEKKYKSAGALIKAVIEEYSMLSLPQREAIYFNKKKETIESFIANKQAFRVQILGYYYDIRPYMFVVDPVTQYNYLIAFSKKMDERSDLEILVSMRLSRINDRIRPIPREKRSGKITFQDKKIVSARLEECTPAFLMNHSVDVKVRFSKDGIRRYKEIFYLRPQYTSIEKGDIYNFNCSLFQAEGFFIRLGRDVEILEPPELRERFKEIYRDCNDIYNKK